MGGECNGYLQGQPNVRVIQIHIQQCSDASQPVAERVAMHEQCIGSATDMPAVAQILGEGLYQIAVVEPVVLLEGFQQVPVIYCAVWVGCKGLKQWGQVMFATGLPCICAFS